MPPIRKRSDCKNGTLLNCSKIDCRSEKNSPWGVAGGKTGLICMLHGQRQFLTANLLTEIDKIIEFRFHFSIKRFCQPQQRRRLLLSRYDCNYSKCTCTLLYFMFTSTLPKWLTFFTKHWSTDWHWNTTIYLLSNKWCKHKWEYLENAIIKQDRELN